MDFRFWLQEQKCVRFFMKPFVEKRRQKEYEEYLKSPDSEYIRQFKNRYLGKRCFIIGNGPSLKIEDLAKLKSEYTFGANRIYNLFSKTNWRPTFYLSVDLDVLRHSWKELNNYDFNEMFLATTMDFDMSQFKCKATRIFQEPKFVINKYDDQNAFISEDVSKFFSVGYTVTFTAIQFAIYMGFKEIYLLGMDFSFSNMRNKSGKTTKDNSVKDHFYEKKYKATVPFFYDNNLQAYNAARQYADTHGIKIINATRGGKLEVFKRVDFDTIFL
jgi:hypothetical protein